jgi:hypothetical protein
MRLTKQSTYRIFWYYKEKHLITHSGFITVSITTDSPVIDRSWITENARNQIKERHPEFRWMSIRCTIES